MRWLPYSVTESFPEEVVDWVTEFHFPKQLVPMLTKRGVLTADQCRKLYFGRIEDTHSSTAFGIEMIKAVSRIHEAFINKEYVLVIGNNDVDGITGTALAVGVLKEMCKHYKFKLDYLIIDVESDNRSIGSKFTTKIIEKKPNLIITVNFGIAWGSHIEELNKFGIDVIVTDQQMSSDDFPHDAFAIIQPHFCGYPFKEITGVGIAYQTMKALWEVNEKKVPKWVAYDQLDLVALSAFPGSMELIDDNRIYVKNGLKGIEQKNRLSFHIMSTISVFQYIERKSMWSYIIDVLRCSDTIVKLLISNDIEECKRILNYLEEAFKRLLDEETQIIDKGIPQLKSDYKNINVIIGEQSYNQAIFSNCINKFLDIRYRPTLLLKLDPDGYLRGIVWGLEGINLKDCIQHFNRYLIGCKGSQFKAEISVPFEKAPSFFAELDQFMSDYHPDQWVQTHYWEGLLTSEDIHENMFRALLGLEPTGLGFPKVFWRVTGNVVSEKILGDRKKTAKLVWNRNGEEITLPLVLTEKVSNIHFEQEHTLFGYMEWNQFVNGIYFRAVDVDGNLVKERSLEMEGMLELG